MLKGHGIKSEYRALHRLALSLPQVCVRPTQSLPYTFPLLQLLIDRRSFILSWPKLDDQSIDQTSRIGEHKNARAHTRTAKLVSDIGRNRIENKIITS